MQDHRHFFETLAPRWDEMQSPERQQKLYRLLARFRLALRSAETILEVGTGTGQLLPLLQSLAPQARLVAVDLAAAMLHRAAARAAGVPVVQADALRLPFSSAQFRVALCHGVFPHFADKPAVLAELRRMLSPDSILIILHDIGREQIHAIHRQAGPPIEHDTLPPASEIALMLRQAGFSVVHLEDASTHYLAAAQNVSDSDK